MGKDPKITVLKPAKGAKWMQNKIYPITWNADFPKYLYDTFNIYLFPCPSGGIPNLSMKIKIAEKLEGAHPYDFSPFSNMAPGEYLVRVQSYYSPTVYGDSVFQIVQYKGPPLPKYLDFKAKGLFYRHKEGKIRGIVENKGRHYKGKVKIKYTIEDGSIPPITGVSDHDVTRYYISRGEILKFPFHKYSWGKSNNVPIPTYLIASFTVIPVGYKDDNPADNTYKGKVFISEKADIAIDYMALWFDKQMLEDGQKNTLNGNNLNWLKGWSKAPGFETNLSFYLRNCGGASRTFNWKLTVEGKLLSIGTETLSAGQDRTVDRKVKIPVTKKHGASHKVVLVVDEAEKKNEAYKGSFSNNTVTTHFDISGTVTGSGL